MTFTGGEATAQPELLGFLSERLGGAGTHLALETCGHFAWPANAAALARMDLVYLDLKHLDSAVHTRLTGQGNALILENAERIAGAGIPLVVRLPLIPGLNDTADNLDATARFVTGRLGKGTPVEVLPYHALGRAKFQAIGEPYRLDQLTPPSPERLAWARARLAAGGSLVAS